MHVRTSWLMLFAAVLALPALRWLPGEPTAKAVPTQDTAKALSKETEETVKVDSTLPAYQPVSGISGNLNAVGSDTLSNLMTEWGRGFNALYPNVKFQSESKGSGTAPPALIAGTAQLGPMSRDMKPSEVDDFEGKFGYKPTQIRVAIDSLAIYVNKDNPIEKLSLPQVDAIFGKQRKAQYPKNVASWGDLGLTGDWATRPISLYGRNSASGTYGFVKEHILKNGDFKDTVKEQAGSAAVVLGVTDDKSGIGYSGIGYRSAGVRPVPISIDDKSEPVAVSPSNVYGGKYPITRFLYIYVNKAPNRPLDPLVKEFITYVLSQSGQQGVLKDGYFPLPSAKAAEDLQKIK
jgi:phosphate transport system substrate-binding protein